MKRDFDFIREILLEIEAGKKIYEIRSDEVSAHLGIGGDDLTGMSREDADKWDYHLTLLEDRGLVEFTKTLGGGWLVERITWDGHDFLDSVRDSEIWSLTKQGAKEAGSFSFEIIVAIAKGFIKKKVESHSGVQIDL